MIVVHMIGNAHIDPIWLWRWQAGADEALGTCRAAADRCDEYPEFIFTRGEAWVYQQVERLDPELFARVKTLVARGQWHVVGGQYIQPDSNLPTEMGWHRQFQHGRRYFRDRFGVTPTVAYNVDSFGHPATLPDILADLGCTGYVFHRPNAQQVPLPAPAFRWVGPAGGEVLGFRITPAYVTHTDDLYGQIMLSLDIADPDLGHTMCFYGVGDHGGGPTKANIEYILANRHAFPGAELRFSTPKAFFEAIATERDRLPVVSTELQHTFPGCYSVMHDVKQAQRHGEHLLDQCDRLVTGLVADREQQSYRERIDRAWDDLLFTEFHDILAGTSIPAAWRSVRAFQGRAWAGGEEVAYDVTRRWARRTMPPRDHQQIIAINSGPEAWAGLLAAEPFLDFDVWGDRWLSDADGNPLDFQRVQPEAQMGISRVLVPATIPAGFGIQILVRDDAPPPARPVPSDLDAGPDHLANAHVRLDLDGRGIRRLAFAGTEVLGEGGIGLHLREDHTDTWAFTTDRFDEPVFATLDVTDGWTVEERGPLRVRGRLDGRLGDSIVRWTVSLHRDDPRVYLGLEITFAERFKALQLPIRLASQPSRWTDGQAGGRVEREPGATEWPVQGWSRVQVGDAVLALLTGDAYSVGLDGATWQWTLLRSPKMAWGGDQPEIYAGRDVHTDQGVHEFAFVLHPAPANPGLTDVALHTAARQLLQPPIVFDRTEGLHRPPWGNNPPPHLRTGAEQRAIADGRMLHLKR